MLTAYASSLVQPVWANPPGRQPAMPPCIPVPHILPCWRGCAQVRREEAEHEAPVCGGKRSQRTRVAAALRCADGLWLARGREERTRNRERRGRILIVR